jgi:hypothetical protein
MSKASDFVKLVEQEGGYKLPDAEELTLYIDNTEPIYRRKVDAFKNLTKKKKKGDYDPELAAKLMLYVVEAASKESAKQWNEWNEIDPPLPWNKVYTMEVRKQAAKDLVADFESAFEGQEYNFMRGEEE